MERVLWPCFIGKCKIQNRFVMPAVNLGWCPDGFISDRVISFYRRRAEGGVGLMIAGAAGIDPVRVNQADMMQISDDRFLPGMERLVQEVHRENGKIFLQIMHAGAYGRQQEHGGMVAVAPSGYFCNFTREMTRELKPGEIRQIVSWFREGAARAKKAGFDGIELAGSAGYLIAEFLSGATNRRQDGYGGPISRRVRFLEEVLEAVRQGAGEDYPVILRLSGADLVPGGNGPEEVAEIVRAVKGRVDALDITGGWHESQVPQITYHVPEGGYLYLAAWVKEQAGGIGVIGCNRLDGEQAADAVERGICDMAGILRGLIADPDLVNKYKDGKADTIRPCLACNQQCLEPVFSGEMLACAVNPFVGRESSGVRPGPDRPDGCRSGPDTDKPEGSRSGPEMQTRLAKQSVLVIGAGISGMVYAALSARKNQVTVWEKSLHYGGAARAVARLPGRENVNRYVEYLFGQCVSAGVTFRWNREGRPEEIRKLLEKGVFDQVVVAAGSVLDVPELRPWEKPSASVCAMDNKGRYPYICTPEQILLSSPVPGRRIVVTGSGYRAVQTAQYCALARKQGDREQAFLEQYIPGHRELASRVMGWQESAVTLLSPEKRIGGGFGKSTRWIMVKETERLGIFIETEAFLEGTGPGRVVCRTAEGQKEMPCDLVVWCQGWKGYSGFDSLKAAYGDRLVLIGDARRPGRITEAVKDAFTAAII